jgi:imidazolonepropionase
VFAASREEEFVDKIRGMSYGEIAAKGGGILNSAKKLNEMKEDKLFDLAWKRLNEVINLERVQSKSKVATDYLSWRIKNVEDY